MKNGIEQETIVYALAFLVLGTMAFNVYLQGDISKQVEIQSSAMGNMRFAQAPVGTQSAQGGAQNSGVISFQEFLPKGVPAIYGAELGVSFDKTVESLNVLSGLDGDLFPNGKLRFADLDDAAKQDYIRLGMSISCEYCCGAEYIVAPNGQPACGCAHSAAMRGLAMYLLKNHRAEFTNEQILEQMTMWKTMFFPKQMYQKAVQLQSEGTSLTGTVLDEVPDMVGGC
ncbi:MAG: hypothetical protein NUV67_01745 [archaeon]|nr:hypothetical protein [archaeon]